MDFLYKHVKKGNRYADVIEVNGNKLTVSFDTDYRGESPKDEVWLAKDVTIVEPLHAGTTHSNGPFIQSELGL